VELDEPSNRVIGCALEVHRALEPGLLEPASGRRLARERALARNPFPLRARLPFNTQLLDHGIKRLAP